MLQLWGQLGALYCSAEEMQMTNQHVECHLESQQALATVFLQ